ncbi:hypothetical protein [Microbacterium sp. UFMG61]|jgi:hypothetical protein|uniref:hypothetical protein n=1 Tax=Microbacterium sp. UFMG61 TaxID=2745935 RepID=UPI001890AD93|nr:hypothetical protein [Microbacterium sp. UFMG61]
MADAYTGDELSARLPAALARLSEVAEYDIERMRAIALEEGLEHSPRPRADDLRSLRLQHSEDSARLGRQLRTVISRTLGKPTGTDKAYSSGPFICELRVDDIVTVTARPQRSLESVGAAVVAWMSGVPFADWAAGDGAGIMHPTERLIRTPLVHERPGRISFAVDLGAGLHPAGVVVNDLPQRRAVLAEYFSGLLGEAEVPPYITERKAWMRGARQLMLAGYRSGGNHSLTFIHDDSGTVAW